MRPLILRASLLAFALVAVSELAPAQMTYQTQEPEMTPKKRELYFYGMRAYPFGKIPQGARQEAIYRAETKMARFGAGAQSPQSVNTWKAIGPFDVGGRVRSVVCHPTDGKTLWVGAADGGVWKSTDRGESWTPIMDNENAIAMGALAVDPGNPSVLYAGTGEMSSNIDAYTGAGILKSVDGGGTWRPIGLTNVGAFSRIVVHPKNGSLVFAGATKNNGGFYRSSDGGNTWSRTITDPVSDVTVNPNNASEVWAATMTKGVYHSVDGGLTFSASNIDFGQIGASLVRVSLQCAPSQPSTLYALTYETVGSGDAATHFSRIYKSTNSGAGWSMIFNNQPNFLNSTGSAQGWYNNVIAVKPDDPNTVVAGGIDLVRTTNGGANWYYINTYTGNGPHPDQHALAFDPTQTNRIYLGNDGGVYRSDDNGSTYQNKSTGLAITQFYAMGVDQQAAGKTYGGTQDNGTVKTGSTGEELVLGGDGFFVLVDHSNSNILYAENPNGIMYRINLANGERRRIVDGIPAEEEGAWSSPIAMDPSNPSLLWHGRKTIYQTLDQGESWIPTSATFKGLSSAFGISPVRPDIVYAGSDRGELLITTDQGFSWTDRTNAPGMPHRAITDIIGSATNEGTFYLSVSGFYSGHVFKTTDGGATWTNISGQLPDIPVNAIAIHPDDEKIIYAGTDIGMFITTDGGETWYSYNEGLPRVAIADLEVHRSQKTLRMASHGRSMWEIALEKPEPAPSILSPIGGEVWMGGTQHAITWSGINGPVNIEFSLDDGAHWGLLASNVTAYSWKIFDTMAVAARVRIIPVVGGVPSEDAALTSRSFTIAKYAVGGLIRAAQVTTIPYGLVYDGEFVWATDFGGSKLLKLDANTLSTIEEVQLDPSMGDSLFTDLAYNPKTGHFFVHKLNNTTETSPGGMLFEIDRNGHEIRRWQSLCAYPIGLVFVDNGGDGELVATDRNGSQNIFILDAADPSVRKRTVQRSKKVLYGPRGATIGPDGQSIYQVITDFTGEVLQTAIADKMRLDNQQSSCTIALTSPLTSGYINARGIEFDPRDSNLWVSDYTGSIFKIISCDSKVSAGPPPVLGTPGEAADAGVSLEQNLPNPFSSSTSIGFTLRSAGNISIDLFDENGRAVAQLASGRYEAGSHRVSFDPAGIPSGVYRYTLRIDGHTAASRTMIYVK